MRKRSYVLVVLAVFTVALAMRTIPLYWSPLPSTLDSFAYASLARDTIAGGAYPYGPTLRADFFVLTFLTAIASLVTGDEPVYVIQPLVSVIGAAIVLVGVALTRRLGTEIGLSSRHVRFAALTTGVLLAVQGLFLRRTTVPDPEVLGILLALLSVIALHRVLWMRDNRWLVPFFLFLVTYPLLHIFSSFNAAVMLVGLFGLALAANPSRRTVVLGGALVAVFWATFVGYYELVQHLKLFRVTYVERVRSHPGLFVAWLVALTVGAAWYQRTTARIQRAVFLVPLFVLFVLVVANVFVPVYPGTIESPPQVAFLIAFLAVPVAFAGYAAPAVAARYDHAAVVVATLVGPLVLVYFSLTASLTPDYFATGMRAQTFMQVPAFVLVGLAAVTFLRVRATVSVPWSAARTVAVVALVGCTLVTVPVAFVTLDTFNYPATTAESEFATVDHATTHLDRWTSHQPQTRMSSQYFGASNVSLGPTRTWLAGGEEPACAVVSLESWTTTGAHFWPSQPRTIDATSHDAFLNDRNVVYANTGRDPLTLSTPRGASPETRCGDDRTDGPEVEL